MTPLLGAAAVLLAALIKGAIGFGFPTLATPLLSLFIDVKAAVVVLILPNIVMDGIQFARRGAPLATVRRFAILLVFGALGTVIGTRLLVALSSRTATLVLGAFLLVFVTLSVTGATPRVPARGERWLSPVAGLVAGVVGGLTNVPGTPLVIYFQSLGMTKHEFVSSVAFTFVVYKLIQLGAVAYYGLLTWSLVGMSVMLVAVALTGFAFGLKVQDRLEARAFNRAVLGFLAALGLWLVIRSVPW
ncbi:MAG: sulfite exporter TauE/SafE family protein [Candidatus Rokubacteria bacterium]|nr:sulfite exporter TauE/SafE family protein [Candidatus Rokubacteria bacterium]